MGESRAGYLSREPWQAGERARRTTPDGPAAQQDRLRGLQRAAGNQTLTRLLAPASDMAGLPAGESLDPATRLVMESRLGADFGAVRVHRGQAAARSAEVAGARAFTVGDDIVLGATAPPLHSGQGQRLLAHELAHVVQQRLGGYAPSLDPASTSERDAEAAASAIAAGRSPAPIIRGTAVGVARQPINPPDVKDKPPAPYVVAPKIDEVALRASPSGRRADSRFHNLVASFKRDARLLVEGNKGHWMRVRAISGTALDGRTNEPRPAAGLIGYVSEELLVRTNEPIPVPIRPEDYHSLKQFSQDWPYQDPTGEAEKIWVSQSKQAWTNKALAAAGIKSDEWKPRAGFRKSRPIFEKVYAYYTSLYLADQRLKWAAMAKLAGGEVYRGFRDEIVPAEEFGEALARAGKRRDGELSIGEFVGGVYQVYAGSMDIVLLRMQQAIFMDLAWQHQAYREGGIKALAAATARGELDKDGFAAWQDIDSGDPSRVSRGNVALLKREQYQVLQGGGHYKQIQDIPDNNTIPETMSEEAKSPIPGGRPFADVVPGGDITKFEDRWKWLEKDMIPAYEKLDPAELQRLVKKSLNELADRKF